MNNKIEELNIDEWIWIIFIILSLFNIYGDERSKCYYVSYNNKDKELSKNIFTTTVFISFLIYMYLFNKRYKVYKYNKDNNLSTRICGTRFFASILVVVASFLYLYCQINDNEDSNPNIV